MRVLALRCGRLVHSLCTATAPAENLVRRLVCRIGRRRNALPELHRSRRAETSLYLHRIGSNEKRSSTAIKTMPSRIRFRADSLSVPKTIGTGPIITTPPPRTWPAPLADLRRAMITASIPTATPARARTNPMMKMMLSAKFGSSLTVSRPDIGFPSFGCHVECLPALAPGEMP